MVKFAVVALSAASEDTVEMDAEVAFMAACMVAVDAEMPDESDAIKLVRVLVSVETPVLMTAWIEFNDEFAALMDVENDTTEPARAVISVEIAALNAVSVATKDVDAVVSPFPTAFTDAARTLISETRIVESTAFLEVITDVALDRDADTDRMDALNVLTSVDNAVLMVASAVESDTSAELKADETDATALVRFTISVDNAFEVAVTSAITLAI